MKENYKKYNDVQLSELLQLQDKCAFEELYNRYWFKLYAFARNMLQTDEEAKDVVQESFIKLYQKLPGLSTDTSVVPYLYQCVRNAVLDLYRRSKSQQLFIESFKAYYKEGTFQTDEQVRFNELSRLIEETIETMSPQMRRIYEMSRKGFMSNLEIADELDISEESVKKQLYRAGQKLRKRFGRKFWLNIMLLTLYISAFFSSRP